MADWIFDIGVASVVADKVLFDASYEKTWDFYCDQGVSGSRRGPFPHTAYFHFIWADHPPPSAGDDFDSYVKELIGDVSVGAEPWRYVRVELEGEYFIENTRLQSYSGSGSASGFVSQFRNGEYLVYAADGLLIQETDLVAVSPVTYTVDFVPEENSPANPAPTTPADPEMPTSSSDSDGSLVDPAAPILDQSRVLASDEQGRILDWLRNALLALGLGIAVVTLILATAMRWAGQVSGPILGLAAGIVGGFVALTNPLAGAIIGAIGAAWWLLNPLGAAYAADAASAAEWYARELGMPEVAAEAGRAAAAAEADYKKLNEKAKNSVGAVFDAGTDFLPVGLSESAKLGKAIPDYFENQPLRPDERTTPAYASPYVPDPPQPRRR